MTHCWLVEYGVGEDRAILMADGHIVEARLRRHDSGPFVGEIVSGQMKLRPHAHLVLADGPDVQIRGPLRGRTEGQPCVAEITREAIGEISGDHSRVKPPSARLVDNGAEQHAPSLMHAVSGKYPAERHVLAPAPATDAFAMAGWYELIEQASSGMVAFTNGRLIVSPTPGMTVIDVDGSGPVRELSTLAARAAAEAILRLDIGGAIAIDFPSLELRADRQHVATIFDDAMHGPYERTAINGFGLMQIIRKRERPSLLEVFQYAPRRSGILTLLREAERQGNLHRYNLILDQSGLEILQNHPHWMEELQRRAGTAPNYVPGARDVHDYRLEHNLSQA